jgi:hypothetical protein
VLLPSAEERAVELLAARADGAVRLERVGRDGVRLAVAAAAIWKFVQGEGRSVSPARASLLAPLVFSWLAGRGARATRIDPGDVSSARELVRRIALLLCDRELFSERIVVIRSKFRSTSTRP